MATAIATSVANGADRRKSGRATHAPPIFSQEQHYGSIIDSAKRKRPADVANGDDEAGDEDEVESETEDDEDGEADEEELREKRRKTRSKQPVAKPAAKRPKTTKGASTTLAIRSTNVLSKSVSNAAKQKARSRPSQIRGNGLYADVFGQGLTAEEAANTWHNFLEGDHVAGLRDMVNFILQVAGCDGRITVDDINDVDHVHERLGDILAEYAEQKPGDYPLSGKQKQFYGMKEVFSEFFRAIPRALHNSRLMYEETAIYENLHIWIATMAGASYRSFRHTATTASLAMTTGQTEIAKELQTSIATTKRQLDNEKKKKSTNKGRLAKLQEEMSNEEKKLDQIDGQLKDAFDTVYVHRYRDVEERLRVECATAMGTWIINYPNMFLEGQYLRYIGWVMSDPHAPTRLEVMKQLKKMYAVKSNRGNLRSFTDRFRKRMVEMGARDADLGVRVESIEFLNQLRSLDLLEPEDIDTVGQLVFDNEPRVRKAVAQFFVSNIEDLYAACIEDFDAEQFSDALPNADSVDDPAEPSKLWIKFKCLAQTLGAQTRDAGGSTGRKLEISGIDHLDSRYMVATQAIFSSMPELQEWESLAGYLLFDHSSIKTTHDASDISAAIQEAYKLEEGEDIILLDVLFCAARLSLQEAPNTMQGQKGKKFTKADKDQLRAKQETAAHNLSVFIPQLHNKFGSDPHAAKSILRLHQLFDPDLVDDVDEGEGEQGALLDDVNKQFTTHNDAEVLAEASRALRAALGHESSKEAADKKVGELWHDLTLRSLSPLLAGQNASQRGTLDRKKSRQLADVTGRLAHLASVKDCCEVLEGKMSWQASKSKRKTNESMMDIILQLVKRGEPDEDTPREAGALEDQTCRFALRILSLYYRWKVVAVRNAITANANALLSTGALTKLSMHKNDFVEAVLPVITSRRRLDAVRMAAILSLVDLYVLFATLRHARPSKRELDDDTRANVESLVTELSSTAMAAIMETHEKMERRLARKTNKRNLEFPLSKAKKASKRPRRSSATPAGNGHDAGDEVDRPPEDSDDEDADGKQDDTDDVSSSDDGDDVDSSPEEGGSAKEAKKKAALVAETSLCELTAKIVLALLAGVVPKSTEVKARLQVNRTKLGKSYTQVIAYLDEKKEKSKSKSKGAAAPKTPVKKDTAKKSAAVVEPMELSDDEIEDDEQREDDDPDALREQGLEDDPVEEANDEAEEANVPAQEDEIMGD